MNWKNLWTRARTGLLVGMLVQLILLWSMRDTYGSALEITVWMGASVIYGVASGLFDQERLNLLAATAQSDAEAESEQAADAGADSATSQDSEEQESAQSGISTASEAQDDGELLQEDL